MFTVYSSTSGTAVVQGFADFGDLLVQLDGSGVHPTAGVPGLSRGMQSSILARFNP